jgi:hypothetical protein
MPLELASLKINSLAAGRETMRTHTHTPYARVSTRSHLRRAPLSLRLAATLQETLC